MRAVALALCLVACTADTFSTTYDAAESDAAVDHGQLADGDVEQDSSKSDAQADSGIDAAQDALSDGKDDAPEAPEAETGAGICGYKDQGTCAHFLCTQGVQLVSGCDPDGYVAYICMFKSSACCSSTWSATCVSLAAGLLGVSCSGC